MIEGVLITVAFLAGSVAVGAIVVRVLGAIWSR